MSNVDNKLITSKSSSKHEVEFHDVKIKKGSILRTEVLPLSNQKEIKEAELTITQDVLDRINKHTDHAFTDFKVSTNKRGKSRSLFGFLCVKRCFSKKRYSSAKLHCQQPFLA